MKFSSRRIIELGTWICKQIYIQVAYKKPLGELKNSNRKFSYKRDTRPFKAHKVLSGAKDDYF